MPWALVLALLNAGNSMAARMAMMAMTTRSSMRVNPRAIFLTAVFILRVVMAVLARLESIKPNRRAAISRVLRLDIDALVGDNMAVSKTQNDGLQGPIAD